MATTRALVLFCFCSFLSCVVSNSENDVERGLSILYKNYKHCENSGEMVPCLKIKALKLADRALKIHNIPLFEGVTVIRTENADTDGRSFGVPEFNENALPADADKKDEVLDDLLVDRVGRFFKTHSLQFSLPQIMGVSTEEGRGKKYKKMMGPLIMAAMVKGGFFVYAMKMVGLLAVKALFVSKIALVLAAVIGLKKLFSSGGGESKTIEIVQKPQVSHSHAYSGGHDFGGISQGWETSGQGGSSGGGGGGYGRSLDNAYSAQDLAYGKTAGQQ